MFKKTVFVVSTIFLLFSSPGMATQVATLTDSNIVVTDQDPSKARLAECQPLRGDAVEILEVVKNAGGMLGVNVAKVNIVSGACVGTHGWVGLTRLASPRQ